MTKKNISFLFPHGAYIPIGGFKVVFEYANRLAVDGWKVRIIYPCTNYRRVRWKDVLRYIVRFFSKGYRPTWFQLDRRICQKWVWSLAKYRETDSSIVVGTSIDTIITLNDYNIPFSQKFAFIQDFENWDMTDKVVFDTYHFQMTKIVVSQWLQDLLKKDGVLSILVPNGFDFNFFACNKPIRERNRHQLAYMYHIDKRKGVDVAFRAFELVRHKVPGLRITLFSVYDKPDGLPDFYEFNQNPNKDMFNKIYNDAAIFVGSSYVEGWGLTVGEAMQCGCAVACTDNMGYLEMAKDGMTALVSPVGDAEALAYNIMRLINDDELRYRIAENGHQFIQELDIEKSYQKFKKAVSIK